MKQNFLYEWDKRKKKWIVKKLFAKNQTDSNSMNFEKLFQKIKEFA